MAKNNQVELADLHVQMRITNRLLAARLKTTMKQNELVALLSSTGASTQEIADVLNTTAATVSVTLQRLRKAAKKPNGVEQNGDTAASIVVAEE